MDDSNIHETNLENPEITSPWLTKNLVKQFSKIPRCPNVR